MKVALYVHCFFPTHYHGTETYTLTLAKGLAALGHEPTVITATPPGEPRQPEFIHEYVWEGIKVISIDKNEMPYATVRDTYHQPSMKPVHEQILQRLQPDIVHVCHVLHHSTALLHVTSQMNLPTIATFTDFFSFCYTNILQAVDGTLCNGPNATRSNCVACHLKILTAYDPVVRAVAHPRLVSYTSRFIASLSRLAGDGFRTPWFRPHDLIDRPELLADACTAYRLAIAPTKFLKTAYDKNGFDVPFLVSHFGIDINRDPKKSAPIESGHVRLGFIGQMKPHKGAHLLIEALRVASRSNLSLTIWGSRADDPRYYEQLKAASTGLPIRFAGTFPVSEAARVFSDIDFLVIPSTWYENSPLIMLQALATHTPVVVSDVPGMTEFVQHGRNGFHFPRGDTVALTELLCRIADTENLSRKMSLETSYERTGRDMANDVVSAYEIALDER